MNARTTMELTAAALASPPDLTGECDKCHGERLALWELDGTTWTYCRACLLTLHAVAQGTSRAQERARIERDLSYGGSQDFQRDLED